MPLLSEVEEQVRVSHLPYAAIPELGIARADAYPGDLPLKFGTRYTALPYSAQKGRICRIEVYSRDGDRPRPATRLLH